MPPSETSIDRLERLEQRVGPRHTSVIRFDPATDPTGESAAAHATASGQRAGYGSLITPIPCADDTAFDLALDRSTYRVGVPRAPNLSDAEPVPVETVESPPAIEPPAPDPWRQALDELQRRLAVRARHARR